MSDGFASLAIVMIEHGVDAAPAQELLDARDGRLDDGLGRPRSTGEA